MKSRFMIALMLMTHSANAADTAENRQAAIQSAKTIMAAFGSKQYEQVWDERISAWFKSKVPSKNAFLANISLQRGQLGSLVKSEVVDVGYTNQDSGYLGDIYFVNFANEYQTGYKSYERVVVIAESGSWKMSGLNGTQR